MTILIEISNEEWIIIWQAMIFKWNGRRTTISQLMRDRQQFDFVDSLQFVAAHCESGRAMTQTAAATTAQPNVSAIKEIELCSSNNKLITLSVSCSCCMAVLCNRTIQNNMWMSTCVVQRTCYSCCRLIQIHRSYFSEKWREWTTWRHKSTTQFIIHIVSSENKSLIIISFVNILSWDLMKGNSPSHPFQKYNFTFIFFLHKSNRNVCFF